PEFLAQHSDTWGAAFLFLGSESSAHCRTYTQNRKETRGDEPRPQANGVSRSGHGDLTLDKSRDALKGAGPPLKFDIVVVRQARAAGNYARAKARLVG